VSVFPEGTTWLEKVQWADQVVAARQAAERARTVPQEEWREDGTLPVAAHALLFEDEEFGRQVRWTGVGLGVEVTVVTQGEVGPLRVKPTFEMHNGDPVICVRLVDEEGRTRANAFQMVW
jgi:hypothetical protein